jgi:hypothetical protein
MPLQFPSALVQPVSAQPRRRMQRRRVWPPLPAPQPAKPQASRKRQRTLQQA